MSSEETERLISPSGRLDSEERATYATMASGNDTDHLIEGEGSLSVHMEDAKTFPQYIAALSATLCAVSAGAALGWTSPISMEMTNGEFNDIPVDNTEMGWIGSFTTLGALIMCIPTGIICDMIGRRLTLLLISVPFIVGWLLIIFSNSIIMIYIGRFISGLSVGATCVAAPLYTSEIAQTEIRGALGSYFQLMVTVGIFYAYLVGKFAALIPYTIACAIIPIVFFVIFFIQPETPIYYLKKGRKEEAEKSLRRLRGENYDVRGEMDKLEESLKDSSHSSVSIISTLRKKSNIKAIIISFGLMFFQQLGGINAVIFYTGDIFTSSKMKMDPKDGTILVGAFQVIATFISSLFVDKLGRKILLMASGLIQAVASLLMAIFFTLQKEKIVNDDNIASVGFIPVVALCIFIIMFSVGFGPIPWMISSEVFTAEIKSVVSSAAGMFNWFLAFIVTKFYLDLVNSVGQDTTFYAFAAISLVGVAFIFFFVIETKGKTVMEIQAELAS